LIGTAPADEEVVLKALAKDAGKRFGSVREFAEALECASNETPVFAFQAKPGRQFISPIPFTLKATLAL